MTQLLLFSGIVLSLFFYLIPDVDLLVSRTVYSPESGWVLNDHPVIQLAYDLVPYMSKFLIALSVLGVVLGLLRRYRVLHVPFLSLSVSLLLTVTLALGPWILVNEVLKEHWGRARPRDTVELGGAQAFSPAWVLNLNQKGHSFTSGHAAAAFYTTIFAYLMTTRRRAILWLALSFSFSAWVGFARIAQGGHFLSDVILSGCMILLINHLVMRWAQRRGYLNQIIAR